MKKSGSMSAINKLSQLLGEAYESVEDGIFVNFALSNQDTMKCALYADCISKGYALALEDFYKDCEEAIKVFEKFLLTENEKSE